MERAEHMGQDDRRRAARLACDLPVRLDGGGADMPVHMADVSRTGVRLRIPGELLGVHRLASLAQASRQLHEALGDSFPAELHYEMLGPLVSKTLQPVRVAKLDWERSDVEVGCVMGEALTDEEAGMLGIVLPAEDGEDVPAREAVPAPHHRGPALRRAPDPGPDPVGEEGPRLAWIYPEPGKPSKPLRTQTLTLTRGMAMLAVEADQGWDLQGVPVSRVVEAIDHAYGTDVMLRIVEDGDDLWAGPAEIQDVEVAGSGTIRLGLAYGRELRPDELGRLGLPAPA